jgi:hypothetical protein
MAIVQLSGLVNDAFGKAVSPADGGVASSVALISAPRERLLATKPAWHFYGPWDIMPALEDGAREIQ